MVRFINFIFIYFFFTFCPLREEIPITLSDTFFITIPIDSSNVDDCEEIAQCVSGETYSLVTNPDGCQVFEKKGKLKTFFFYLIFFLNRYLRKTKPISPVSALI